MKVNKFSFNENIYGDQIEYVIIEDEKEKILIFEYYEKIHIVKIENERKLLEKLIECKILNDYLNEVIQEQEDELEDLEKDYEMEDQFYENKKNFKYIDIDNKIEEYRKWQSIIKEELKLIENTDNETFKIIESRLSGATFEKIQEELYLGHRTVMGLYNNFIMEVTLLALKNDLISI